MDDVPLMSWTFPWFNNTKEFEVMMTIMFGTLIHTLRAAYKYQSKYISPGLNQVHLLAGMISLVSVPILSYTTDK